VQSVAYVAPALTAALVLTRPRISARLRVGPASAGLVGVALVVLSGVVTLADLSRAALDLWRPNHGVAAIIITAAVAERVGLIERAAAVVERRTRGSVSAAFATTFALAVITATFFNNDAAILLLTPLIVRLVRRRYPLRQYLVVPFAFAIFAAAGVAPLPISNPINYIVAERAGIGWVLSFLILSRLYRREIDDPIPGRGPEAPLGPMSSVERRAVGLIVVVLGAYPVVSSLGGPVWAVSVAGAVLCVVLATSHDAATPRQLAGSVAWDVLFFLFTVFVMAMGLSKVGAVQALAGVYRQPTPALQIGVIGLVSAGASALLNNHPMAVLNSMALEELGAVDRRLVLAALVGGDLGPRLLPIGSLAGLLWLKQLRRMEVEIGIRRFVAVGAAVTVPTLLASLTLLLLR
jgi:arsenical pump membrane protein